MVDVEESRLLCVQGEVKTGDGWERRVGSRLG